MHVTRLHRIHAMAQLIDAGKQPEGTQATSSLRPAAAVSAQVVLLHPARGAPTVTSRRPVWHKDNFGFWLLVCVLISLVFSLIYRSLV